MKGVINQVALVVFGVLAAATLLLAVYNDHGLLAVYAQSQKLVTVQAEVEKIQTENKQLADEIHALRTDPTTIEKLAREELRLVKPGEVVLVTPAEH
jgi:cell division protein FtsB